MKFLFCAALLVGLSLAQSTAITAVAPQGAAPSYNSVITIYGSTATYAATALCASSTTLAPGAAITFGGESCASLTVSSGCIATCTLPRHTGAVTIAYSTTAQSSTAQTLGYTYAAPVVTLVNPSSIIAGSAATARTVTIMGTNFGFSSPTATRAATIGGAACETLNYLSDTSLQCVTPATTSAGSRAVLVTITGQSSNSNINVVATATCGDSIANGGETCDDGNTRPSDGCSATCTVESGYVCSTATPNVCSLNSVGQSFLTNIVSTPPLSPSFLISTLAYTVAVGTEATSIPITATAPSGATLTINGATATSGVVFSVPISATTPTITVVSTVGGQSSTYVITVSRSSAFTVSLGSGAVSSAEGFTASIPVIRTGSTNDAFTIAYSTATGTASTSDFTNSATSVSFAKGESIKFISISISADAIDEPAETFTVSLGAIAGSTSGALGSPSSATVTIVANSAVLSSVAQTMTITLVTGFTTTIDAATFATITSIVDTILSQFQGVARTGIQQTIQNGKAVILVTVYSNTAAPTPTPTPVPTATSTSSGTSTTSGTATSGTTTSGTTTSGTTTSGTTTSGTTSAPKRTFHSLQSLGTIDSIRAAFSSNSALTAAGVTSSTTVSGGSLTGVTAGSSLSNSLNGASSSGSSNGAAIGGGVGGGLAALLLIGAGVAFFMYRKNKPRSGYSHHQPRTSSSSRHSPRKHSPRRHSRDHHSSRSSSSSSSSSRSSRGSKSSRKSSSSSSSSSSSRGRRNKYVV